ncbi:MAG: PLP-dependent aminotransferase family protein [Actinobacteria bacterium]|nr:PLP-dependent aminotransferase family protein [Actinomycetota bacterium]
MAIEWSGLGPELLLRLDRSAGQPLRAQLETSLREAIRDGRLRGGERLPSSRELARGLGVSRGMVQDCYGQLLAEGYLTSRGGSATRVADVQERPAMAAAPAAPPVRPVAERTMIADFQPGVPDLTSFPRADWARAVGQACTEIPTADLGYGDPRGSAVLRDVLAAYLRRIRAADAHPAQMIVTTGFAQGVNLVLRALIRERAVSCVAIEDPGYGPAEDDETVRAFLAMGLRVAYVPVDEEGLVVSALAATGAEAVVVTPAHQAPMGMVLSAARRHALLDWARQTGGYVIEDDYDSEFRYDSEPVGTLQGLAPDQVFLLGTASKALAPAMRLGWMQAPPALAAAVAAEKEMNDRGSNTVDQLALALLLTSGRYDRHLRRMRGVYAARRAALVAAFARHCPAVRLTGLVAGFQAVALLPAAAGEAAVIAAARDRRVGLYGLAEYRGQPDPAAWGALVIGFGNVAERAIDPAFAAVADLLR